MCMQQQLQTWRSAERHTLPTPPHPNPPPPPFSNYNNGDASPRRRRGGPPRPHPHAQRRRAPRDLGAGARVCSRLLRLLHVRRLCHMEPQSSERGQGVLHAHAPLLGGALRISGAPRGLPWGTAWGGSGRLARACGRHTRGHAGGAADESSQAGGAVLGGPGVLLQLPRRPQVGAAGGWWVRARVGLEEQGGAGLGRVGLAAESSSPSHCADPSSAPNRHLRTPAPPP